MPVYWYALSETDHINNSDANGKDYNAGGARYNSNYIQGVGNPNRQIDTFLDQINGAIDHL